MLKSSICCLVLGLPRSGTSITAGIVHRLGFSMGDRLMKRPVQWNPTGYFEDVDFLNLHEAMLGNWKYEDTVIQEPTSKYSELIKRRCEQKLWGLKDPRLCFLLPTFVKHNKWSKIMIVSTDRPVEDSARSLEKMFPDMDGQYVVQKSIDAKRKSLKSFDGPLMEISYKKLMKEPESKVAEIADFLGVPNDPEIHHMVERR